MIRALLLAMPLAISLASQPACGGVPTASAHVAFASMQPGVRGWGECPTGSERSCSAPGGAALLRRRIGGHRLGLREEIGVQWRRDAGRGLFRGGLSSSAAGGESAEVGERERIREAVASAYAKSDFWALRNVAIERAKSTSLDGISVDTGDYTYGEFDLDFFLDLLTAAQPREGGVLLDVGSGNGRLVLAAALAFPQKWSVCRGVEIVPELHAEALSTLAARIAHGTPEIQLELADIFERPYLLRDVDVCFCYSTAFGAVGPYLSRLSYAFGTGLRVGTRVITVDKELASEGPWEFEELLRVEGRNKEVSRSTGFVYRVSKSPLET